MDATAENHLCAAELQSALKTMMPSHLLTRPAYLPCLPKMVNSISHQRPLSYGRLKRFAPFCECSFRVFMDHLSQTTSHAMLLPISQRRATTPHCICSLLHTVSYDTQDIKPSLFSRSDHNRPLGSSIPNNTQECLVLAMIPSKGT